MDDSPAHPTSRPRHTGPASSSARTHTQPWSTGASVQSLITKSNEAKERHDFDKVKSLPLQIPDKTIFEPLLEALDIARQSLIQPNKDLEREAKKAELKGDWQTAKSLLSRIVGEDGPFLVLALEYSRTRLGWELEAEEYMEQLKKEYPDPCLEQVELDHNYEDAKMTGNPRRIGHHQGLLRVYKRKYGSLWDKPDDFRKAFQIMAADRRRTREKAWYTPPARAGKTELESQSQSQSQFRPQPQPESDSGFDSRAGLQSETGARSQSQSRHQPQQLDIAEGLHVLKVRTEARPQPQSQQPDIDQGLALLDRA
ncbi:hypothetical protein N7449_012010 [Penicillium cf. viridicatum]|uniref:Uncharacterized protein n=1 Tax=Penicillium cf. viridicatum TaxID=2972119 RepID=A0A9W9IPH9_9EURO|nr:hypothetical protein N7449_012010 [Penicillium cf. viridicatum]